MTNHQMGDAGRPNSGMAADARHAFNRVIASQTIAPAWEASLALFLSTEGMNRYDSRGVPCIEIEDLLFDIASPLDEPRVSRLYPKHYHRLIDDFTERLVRPQIGQVS